MPLSTVRILLLLAGIALSAACQSPIACADRYKISAASRVGCRAPDELGCATCCTASPGSRSCSRRSWAPGGADVSKIKPWYNANEYLAETCPASCPPCASCTVRAEGELCELLAMPRSCDCVNLEPGNDPCAEPTSCGCYCRNLSGFKQSCPTE